jgi:hypothetical protein
VPADEEIAEERNLTLKYRTIHRMQRSSNHEELIDKIGEISLTTSFIACAFQLYFQGDANKRRSVSGMFGIHGWDSYE